MQVASGGVLSGNRMWKSPLAWIVAIYMGLQSTMFYVTISWLPEILHDYGMSMETAGWLLSLTQIVGLPASFFLTYIGRKNEEAIHCCKLHRNLRNTRLWRFITWKLLDCPHVQSSVYWNCTGRRFCSCIDIYRSALQRWRTGNRAFWNGTVCRLSFSSNRSICNWFYL